MKGPTFSIIIVLLIAGCSAQNTETEGSFITLLGTDTVAVETFTKTEDGLEARVVVRVPQTTLTEYKLVQDEFGGVKEFFETRYLDENGFSGERTFNRSIVRQGDSLVTNYITRAGSERSFTTLYEEGALPFIEMTHWPFDLALQQAEQVGGDTLLQNMISGNSIRDYVIANLGGDTRTIRHPSRGVMDVEVNAGGKLRMLDAAQTTRKLLVERVAAVDIEEVAERFKELDSQGKSFGSLSGAVEEEFSIGSTNFKVSYGSPLRRGRDLFGGIVPFGQRWRTGANRAAHFSTSSDLTIGSLNVPAGEYTMFTIPEADGGTFIINKQTGQNGRTYDEARDLGRIPMSVLSKEESTEAFTITVEGSGDEGRLNLIWGNTVYYVDFEID